MKNCITTIFTFLLTLPLLVNAQDYFYGESNVIAIDAPGKEFTVPDNEITISKVTLYAENITGNEGGLRGLSGNVVINKYLQFSGEVIADQATGEISGTGDVFITGIGNLDTVKLFSGDFIFHVPLNQDAVISFGVDKANQAFEVVNMPIIIEGVILLEDGIQVFGDIQLPKVLGTVSAEIDSVWITKSRGLEVTGKIELDSPVKIHGAISLNELSFEFDTKNKMFIGSAIIEKKPLFEAGAGVYIIETGLDSVGVFVELGHPKPLGTTGLALARAEGFVDNIQNGPLTIGLGTTLVPVGVPSNFVAFESLLLTYELGTKMTGSGDFVLFNQAMSNATFEIEKERMAIEVNANFNDILLAYMYASVVKNEFDGIDFIGKFRGELQIPNGEGIEYRLYESLLRKAFKDNALTLPFSLAGTDNVIFNTELTGRAWLARSGKKDFEISYLLEYKNGQINTDFAKGFKLFNEDVFTSSANGRVIFEYLNLEYPESRLDGRSLIINGASNAGARTNSTNTVDQDFVISSEVETIVVRVKGESSIPTFQITDPDGNVVSESSNFQNYQYLSNSDDNSSFIIVDLPILGSYSISIEDTGDNYFVDVIGNEGAPGFIIDDINRTEDKINIKWTDDNRYDDAKISFYYDDDKQGADGKPIELSISEDDETDSINWVSTDDMPGSYYVYGIMSDTLGNLIVNYFDEPITLISSLEAPSNLKYLFKDDMLNLEWNRSNDCENCDYLLFIANSENITTSSPNQSVGDTLNYSLSNLQFGKTYFISVAGRNEEGILTGFSNTVEVALVSQQVNNLPVIKSVEYPEIVKKGESVTITFDLFDADNDDLTLEAIKAPTNISISSNTISWDASSIGKNQFYIKVSDQDGLGDSIRFFIDVLEQELLAPSLNANKSQLSDYGESVSISLRNPALANVNSDIIVQAHTMSNPNEVFSLQLSTLDAEIGLYSGSLSLDREQNLNSGILKVSRMDTLMLSYRFNDETFIYQVAFNGPNTAPENLAISNLSVDENQTDELIGILSARDYDNDDLLFVISSSSDEFKIIEDALKSNTELNFEEQSSYNLTISVSDGFDVISQDFMISINDVNENPTDIIISSDTISENKPIGSTIGVLTSEDEDENESFSYTITGGSETFKIDNDKLLSNVKFDFEDVAMQTLEITTTDDGGLSFTKSFNITIIDVYEAPLLLNANDIEVYPNPVTDILIINWSELSEVVISEISGKELKRVKNNAIDFGSYSSGIYVLQLIGKNGEIKAIRIRKE